MVAEHSNLSEGNKDNGRPCTKQGTYTCRVCGNVERAAEELRQNRRQKLSQRMQTHLLMSFHWLINDMT